jgi:hypothetical protein
MQQQGMFWTADVDTGYLSHKIIGMHNSEAVWDDR